MAGIAHPGGRPLRQQRKTLAIRYSGRRVRVRYRYDPECDRWTLLGENVRGLVMEGDSIECLEAELPDVIAMIEDTARKYGEPPED